MSLATPKSYSQPKRNGRKHGLIPEVNQLSEDALIGTYLVDSVAEELQFVGAKDKSIAEFVTTVRKKLNFAASISTFHAKNYYINEPRRLLKTRRLFSDLKKIKTLIERNKNLDRMDVVLSTRLLSYKKRSWKEEPDEIDNVVTALHRAGDTISELIASRKPEGRGGNHDPFTRNFIYEVSEFWEQAFLWVSEWSDEGRLFIRLLTAAWQDFRLPTRDERGQLLEDWLTDRVRKQFPEGICGVRQSLREHFLWKLERTFD